MKLAKHGCIDATPFTRLWEEEGNRMALDLVVAV